jgi:hypothetical protein
MQGVEGTNHPGFGADWPPPCGDSFRTPVCRILTKFPLVRWFTRSGEIPYTKSRLSALLADIVNTAFKDSQSRALRYFFGA